MPEPFDNRHRMSSLAKIPSPINTQILASEELQWRSPDDKGIDVHLIRDQTMARCCCFTLFEYRHITKVSMEH
jgi:hypothetical protein